MKKRIMIDLDDVIVDQSGWIKVINDYLNSNHTIDDVKGYYIQDLVPEEKMNEYTKYFITQNIYDYCNLNKNCYEVLKELNEVYDVYICSAYVYKDDVSFSAKFLEHKFNFLYKNLPFLDPKKFIFSDDKKVIECDIKIDDKIDNLENANTKILFTCYHNKKISDEKLEENDVIRVYSWDDIKKILL